MTQKKTVLTLILTFGTENRPVNCWDECFLPYWQVTRCTLASVAITDISETRESFLAGLNSFIFLTYFKKIKKLSPMSV